MNNDVSPQGSFILVECHKATLLSPESHQNLDFGASVATDNNIGSRLIDLFGWTDFMKMIERNAYNLNIFIH
jgi:hypothetical protein